MKGCAAEVEVWADPTGWDLTVSDVLIREFDSSEQSKLSVEALIWLTISGGAAIVQSRFGRKLFVPAPHEKESAIRIDQGNFTVRREWCPWNDNDSSTSPISARFNSIDYWQPVNA